MPKNKFLTYIYTLAKLLYSYSSILCLENKLPNIANLFAINFQYALSITAQNANCFYADIDGDKFRLLSKHFCLQPYFTKDSIFLVFM